MTSQMPGATADVFQSLSVVSVRPSMVADRTTLEADDNPEKYEELSEDWFSNADYDPSSSSTLSPFHTMSLGYFVIKRQTYPHWEKDMLKGGVVVKLQGSSEQPKSEITFGIDRAKAIRETASQTESHTRIRAPDSVAQITPTSEEPNNALHDRGRTIVHVNDAHDNLNEAIPNQPGPSTSYLPPHLPPATRFLPFDPRAALLETKSKTELKELIPTFSFSRFQKMVTDSVFRSSVSESSILRQLAGLHNQVQGSPTGPSWWDLPFETAADIERRSFVSSKYDDEVDAASAKVMRDDYSGSDIVDGWPRMRDETLATLRSIEHAFDDSFKPDFHSTSISESSDDGQSLHEVVRSGLASSSECTCSHRRHYVRPTQTSSNDDDDAATNGGSDADDEHDFSFYFRSRPQSLHDSVNIEDDHVSDPGSNFARRFYLADNTFSTTENHGSSGRPTRANANVETRSVTDISFSARPGSRTSSDLYLSPNFPDSEQRNHYFAVAAFPTITASYQRNDETAGDDDEHDNHRVYFAPAETPSPNTLRKFFAATRRRVSSIGKKHDRPNCRSTASAKEELEKTERSRPAEGAKKRQMRVLHKRGRSSTVRPLEPSPVVSREVSPPIEGGGREPQNESQVQPAVSKKERRMSLLHRFFTHIRPGNKNDETAEKTPTQEVSKPVDIGTPSPQADLPAASNTQTERVRSESEVKTRIHAEALAETDETGEARPKPRVQTTRNSRGAMLFRYFSIGSPRTPGSGRRRFTLGRE